MPFGKYKGLTFDEIAQRDLGYLQWLILNTRNDEVARAVIAAVDRLGDVIIAARPQSWATKKKAKPRKKRSR